jgi:methylase of polypeptide subunit release factors
VRDPHDGLLETHPAAKVSVTDAGCGSGILALSAAKSVAAASPVSTAIRNPCA